MNTSWKNLFKAVGIYIATTVVWALIIATLGFILLKFSGLDRAQFKSYNPIFIVPVILAVLGVFLVPPIVTGVLFHRLTVINPDSETRLTLSMILALTGFLISFATGDIQSSGNVGRFVNGELELAEILALLAILAVGYAINLLVVSIGLGIGLRLTRNKFSV